MKEVRYWVANDGTSFEDEDECLNYEFEVLYKKSNKKLIFFTGDLDIIKEGNFFNKLEAADYIFIGNETALELIKKIGEADGLSVPSEIGFWHYDFYGKLTLVNEELPHLEKAVTIMKKYLSLLEN